MALSGSYASEATVFTALEQLLAIGAGKVLRGRRCMRIRLHLVAPVGSIVTRAVSSIPGLLAMVAPCWNLARKRLLAASS